MSVLNCSEWQKVKEVPSHTVVVELNRWQMNPARQVVGVENAIPVRVLNPLSVSGKRVQGG